MKKKRSDIWVIYAIVLIIGAIIFIFALDARRVKYEPIALNASNTILGSMTYLGDLPWSVSEYKLRAILVCNGLKIFVTDNQDYGTIALGCGYYIAQDVELIPKPDFIKGEGYIRFQKESIE